MNLFLQANISSNFLLQIYLMGFIFVPLKEIISRVQENLQ